MPTNNCADDCSGNGICLSGNCYCNFGKTGDDCSQSYENYSSRGLSMLVVVIIFALAFALTWGVLYQKNKEENSTDVVEKVDYEDNI